MPPAPRTSSEEDQSTQKEARLAAFRYSSKKRKTKLVDFGLGDLAVEEDVEVGTRHPAERSTSLAQP